MSYEAVARALESGDPRELSDRALAGRFNVEEEFVARVRAELGVPLFNAGRRARREVVEAAYLAHVEDVEGGHQRWTGTVTRDGVPMVTTRFGQESAHRVAFQLETGRPPVGYVRVSCTYPHCVARGHQADRRLREERRRSAPAGTAVAA
ncbi:hypothetical protein [Streptomyces canus]|uniref:hypothetical protein n=1 Tax=Streptomyces canus TaxID=58343 RepID=UPI002E253605